MCSYPILQKNVSYGSGPFCRIMIASLWYMTSHREHSSTLVVEYCTRASLQMVGLEKPQPQALQWYPFYITACKTLHIITAHLHTMLVREVVLSFVKSSPWLSMVGTSVKSTPSTPPEYVYYLQMSGNAYVFMYALTNDCSNCEVISQHYLKACWHKPLTISKILLQIPHQSCTDTVRGSSCIKISSSLSLGKLLEEA